MFDFAPYLKVFRDDALQAQFEKDGYVVVPFYNQEEIKALTTLYRELHPKDEKGFYPSTFSKDKKYRTTADKEIVSVGSRSMEHLLVDYKVVCGSFIVKSPGPESVMELHQDMTLVDESKFAGINIWCPLVDLTDTNGALEILAGSQRLVPSYRGSSIPTIYAELQNEIKSIMKPLFLKAGEAVIFDQSILHYSPPNISDDIRIVTNTFFAHKDATFQTAWYDKENHKEQIELFEQDDNFLTHFDQFGHDIYARPKLGKSKGLFDYKFTKLSLEMLEDKYGPIPLKKEVESIQEPVSVAVAPKQKGIRAWLKRLLTS